LIDSGILCCESAISWTKAICWHRHSICWKIGSFRRMWQRILGIQNSARRGMARGFGVVARALRTFGATLSQVESDGRIPR
jgi:hypothetical protein